MTPELPRITHKMEAKYLQATYMGCMIQWCRSRAVDTAESRAQERKAKRAKLWHDNEKFL